MLITYIAATSTNPSTSNTTTSNFQESIFNDNACKSIGIEALATVETENGKSGMNIYEDFLLLILH